MQKRTARIMRPRWGGTIFVCGKCLKRHDDGKAVRRALKAEVKAHTKAEVKTGAKRRKTRIVKTACLGLCPRDAVIITSAAMLASGDVMLVQDPDEIADAVPRLLPKKT